MTPTPTDIRSALKAFRADHPSLTLADVPTIERVLAELHVDALAEATSGQYLHDPSDRVHINPTFVVSRVQFSGSRLDETYAAYPWRLDLSGAVGHSSSRKTGEATGYPFCALCGHMAEEAHWTQDCQNQKVADS